MTTVQVPPAASKQQINHTVTYVPINQPSQTCHFFVRTQPINHDSCSHTQEDLFIPTLTPREHLRFHAKMRMDASVPTEEKMEAVENALAGLGLGEFLF